MKQGTTLCWLNFERDYLLILYCKSYSAHHAYFQKCLISQFIASFYCPFFTPHSGITLAKVINGGGGTFGIFFGEIPKNLGQSYNI